MRAPTINQTTHTHTPNAQVRCDHECGEEDRGEGASEGASAKKRRWPLINMTIGGKLLLLPDARRKSPLGKRGQEIPPPQILPVRRPCGEIPYKRKAPKNRCGQYHGRECDMRGTTPSAAEPATESSIGTSRHRLPVFQQLWEPEGRAPQPAEQIQQHMCFLPRNCSMVLWFVCACNCV